MQLRRSGALAEAGGGSGTQPRRRARPLALALARRLEEVVEGGQ